MELSPLLLLAGIVVHHDSTLERCGSFGFMLKSNSRNNSSSCFSLPPFFSTSDNLLSGYSFILVECVCVCVCACAWVSTCHVAGAVVLVCDADDVDHKVDPDVDETTKSRYTYVITYIFDVNTTYVFVLTRKVPLQKF
jgi:hypothetical protein